ncbi:hypothetical protein HanIR_Chr17g0858141 [Helianthus annuus]|nr:hypothetical protein HanIR_Chr17g0858141 [Helianthus annuus]
MDEMSSARFIYPWLMGWRWQWGGTSGGGKTVVEGFLILERDFGGDDSGVVVVIVVYI